MDESPHPPTPHDLLAAAGAEYAAGRLDRAAEAYQQVLEMQKQNAHIQKQGETIDSVNPFTGKTWARIPRGTEGDAVRAVEAAHAAFIDFTSSLSRTHQTKGLPKAVRRVAIW